MRILRLSLALLPLLCAAADAQVLRLQPSSTAAEGSRVLCAGPCSVGGLQVNSGASAGWVMIFNATAAPSDGAVVPVKWYQVAANQTLAVSWDIPLRLTTGCTVVFSTTGPFTKTISATATISGEIQ